MSLETISTGREAGARDATPKALFEHFRFRRVWCPTVGRDCAAVVRVVNGMEVDVTDCPLRERTGNLGCTCRCLS